jgi:hypothetical protein
VDTIKRLRIDEGPEDPTVYQISKKVNQIVHEREKSRVEDTQEVMAVNKGQLNEKIREGIKMEGRAIREQYEILGNVEPVFRL